MNLANVKTQIEMQAESLLPQLIEIRRHLHQFPELGRQEQQTTAYLVQLLKSLPLKLVTHPAGNGLWADLIHAPQAQYLALRCDIDALPIQEQNQVEYVSQIPGQMHACGHDAHTAMLVGTATILSQLADKLPGNVRFIFQPAEELTPGGALDLIERGVLERVQAIISQHVDPRLGVGKIGIKSGPLMASTDIFRIKLFGRGGHAASPDKTIDTILITAQLVNALHHLVSRDIAPTVPAVLSVTRINVGTAINIIPGEAEIWGTLRALDPATRQFLKKRLEEIIAGVCQIHHARFTLKIEPGAPPVINDANVTEIVLSAALEMAGPENLIPTEKPEMGAEDFAWYLQKVPGMIFRLGTHGRPGTDFELHHPNFDLDESALINGVKTLCWSVIRYFINQGLETNAG